MTEFDQNTENSPIQMDENQDQNDVSEENVETDNVSAPLSPIVAVAINWNTSLVCQCCREGDVDTLRSLIDYSQQALSCRQHASEIVDRIDSETGLSPLHHAARYQHLDICLMLISNMNFKLGVNIRDENGQTPIHAAIRRSNTKSSSLGKLRVDTDFGNEIQFYDVWQEEYSTKIINSRHPLIYLFTKANGDLNARDKYYLTPLHYAVARNELAAVEQLIECGAEIECEDRQGIRPLHIACREGFQSIVEFLINKGAQVDCVDSDQLTILHFSALKGQLDICRLIKTKNSTSFENLVRMKTRTKSNVLHVAVRSGRTELVEFFLEQLNENERLDFLNEIAEPIGTCLHVAAQYCDGAMIKFLIERSADPSIVDENEQTALHLATLNNRVSIVDELCHLIDQQVVNKKDKRGRSPIFLTSNIEIVKCLVEAGSDLTICDNGGMNPLMCAVSTGRFPIVEYFLSMVDQIEQQNGRNISQISVDSGNSTNCSIKWNAVDKRRWNLFHWASLLDDQMLIDFLSDFVEKQEKKENSLNYLINGQNEEGKTALHLAAEFGRKSSVEALLKNGGDPSIVDFLGQIPLMLAVENDHEQIVEILLDDSSKLWNIFSPRSSLLNVACRKSSTRMVKLLIDRGILSLSDSKEDLNPLEIAIRDRRNSIVETLVENRSTQFYLESVRENDENFRQTPLRDLIKTMPNCAERVLDKLIVNSEEIDVFGDKFQRTEFSFRLIDDYLTENGKIYSKKSAVLYRNHPLIIALDYNRHSIIEHPLVHRLLKRKWKIYRPFFYAFRLIHGFLLFFSWIFSLLFLRPLKDDPNSFSDRFSSFEQPARWILLFFSTFCLLKIVFEVSIYRGFRVPFGQILGFVSFFISILAFAPVGNRSFAFERELIVVASLFQCFHFSFVLRLMPFFGQCMALLESVLIKITQLIFVTSPILFGLMISIRMVFYSQSSLANFLSAINKSAVMFVGELDFENLFFGKSVFSAAGFIFLPFIFLIPIVLMNLFLGVAIGDMNNAMKKARSKADAYWIRELIAIETVLPSQNWIKSKIVEREIDKSKILSAQIDSNAEQFHSAESEKLLEIIQTLSTKTAQILESECEIERTLQRLIATQLQSAR